VVKVMRVLIFGAGYVGLSAGVILASTHEVTVLDIDTEKVELINKGISPIVEEGLDKRLKESIEGGHLRAVGPDYEFKPQDIVLICVGTPSNHDQSVNLDSFNAVINTIDKNFDSLCDGYLVIGQRSTIPPGTTRKLLLEKLVENHDESKFGLVFQPEFLREGHALHDLLNPSRIIIGGSDTRAMKIYREFVESVLKSEDIPIFEMSIESAEMCKYASNCFLATKISYANEMASIAEKISEIDIDDVYEGMVADPRICPSHLRPGLGYGGSCFPKDVKGMIAFGKQKGVPMHMLSSVEQVNEDTIDRLIGFLDNEDLSGRKIAILGITFKEGTDDFRESQSIKLMRKLKSKGAELLTHDPQANLEIVRDMYNLDFKIYQEIVDCTHEAEIIFLMTDWPEYKEIGLERLCAGIEPKYFIDARRSFVKSDIPKSIRYRALGSNMKPK
jgi:UDPglucose 6-dehydrogenase